MTDPTDLPDFGSALRTLRTAAGLTQDELADRAGLSRATVGNLECGFARNPEVETIAALARALGLSFGAFAGVASGVPVRRRRAG